MVFYHTFDGLDEQFITLVAYMYADSRGKDQIYRAITNKDRQIPEFRNTDFTGMSATALPRTIDEMYMNFLIEPITDEDRGIFVVKFPIPFQSTGKSVKELRNINPDTFRTTLDNLIISKKIQYILFNLDLLEKCEVPKLRKICGKIRGNSGGSSGSGSGNGIRELKEKYARLYLDQEEKIAINWINAVESEGRFRANTALARESAKGVFGPKQRRHSGSGKAIKRKRTRKNIYS